MLIVLLAACTPLVGDWEGELDCGGTEWPLEITLDFQDGEYVGEGSLDCSVTYGGGCEESFDIDIQPVGAFGEHDLDVDLDDCHLSYSVFDSDIDCDDADELTWDGKDEIAGDWGSDCEVDLDRQ